MTNKPLSKKDQIRQLAEQDLATFIKLVHPGRVLGQVHMDVINWWTRQEARSHQLLLLPRDHQKSALVAYRVAWAITKNPAVRVLYISSTSNLATKQLKFIKDILTSEIYRYYWPQMINQDENKREKWTETEISVDHPLRKAENVRDPTVFTAGLTTGITGLHCDISVFDDVVVPDNAYTIEGRTKVTTQYSLLASIEGADAQQWVVGTRYHPLDLYQEMISIQVEVFNEDGEMISSEPLYEKYERQVESSGDGTGEFCWPRQQRTDGKWFGFNTEILARKRAQYLDKLQFRAQYYNDPNSLEDAPIKPETFQYYDQGLLRMKDGNWHYKDRRLNVFAAVDFAFTMNKHSDYSCVVVVGVDHEQNYYILDISRFKTDRISEYFTQILRLYEKWAFRKIRAEVTTAQIVIVKDLKENYIRPYGLALSVEEFRPTRTQGSKEERVLAVLQPRYDNLQMWHYKGGNIQLLEEELLSANPAHDDIKDTLATVVEMAVAPVGNVRKQDPRFQENVFNSRFGGIL
jgi:phage terminase large subunit-like protein